MVITPSGRRHHGLRRGLVSFWPLNEASGTRSDVHGGNDLTDNNTVGQSTGITGKPYTEAADIVRANSEYFSYTHDGTFAFVDYLTTCAWVKIDSYAVSGNWLVNKRGAAANGWNLVAITSDSKLYFTVITDTETLFVTSTTTLSTGTWYFVHGQIDGTTIRVGVNGSWEATDTYLGTLSATTEPFALGGASWNLAGAGSEENRHDGNMQAVGIWNRALSAAEVTSLYNGGNGLKYDQF